MGIPQNYGIELPRRSLMLIDHLWDKANGVFIKGQEHLGSLTTTFLVSMAAPIVVLPIERIILSSNPDKKTYVRDLVDDPEKVKEIRHLYFGRKPRESPFYQNSSWRFATFDLQEGTLNIAERFPDEVAKCLQTEIAIQAAKEMYVSQWGACLRNSVAHGGVCYLDKDGYQNWGRRTEFLAFDSGRYDKEQRLVGINVLRISESDFRKFLNSWVDWLENCGLAQQLAA